MKQLTLRNKLYILILTVLIPLLILQLVGIYTRYERAIDNELQVTKDCASAIGGAFLNNFQTLWNVELSIGNHIAENLKPQHFEGTDKYLRHFLNIHPAIRELSWVTPEGKVIISTYNNPTSITDISQYHYYQQIISGKEEVVSDLIVTNEGEMKIAVARGIRQKGALVGIIVAGLDLDKIGINLPIHTRKDIVSFGLVDRNGMIIYQNGNLGMPIDQRKVHENSPTIQALKGQTILSRKHSIGSDGQVRIGASIPVSQIGWAVFATTSITDVLGNARADTNRDIIVLMIIGMVIIMVYGTLISDYFLKPLVKLQKAALAISKGDLTARAGLEGTDELSTTGKIFDQMADRIQQLEVSRTRFLQTAAHELRNPMAGIKGILSLILRKINNGKPLNNMTNMFEIMEKEIDRLSDLLNQILEAFRTQRENGMLALDLKRINLLDVIDSALKPYQLSDRCIYHSDLKPGDTLWILGDFTRLEEVFRNLLSNSMKYSPEESEVYVNLSIEDDHALITVKDQGIGIPKEQLEGIFECFYRASNLEKHDPGGMGLGLYICKEIIDSHVGSIWAESEEGIGSTFYVKLPLY